jgi:hypothetical protein
VSRVRVGAPDGPLATIAGALTRLVPLATLSRQAGEGWFGAHRLQEGSL